MHHGAIWVRTDGSPIGGCINSADLAHVDGCDYRIAVLFANCYFTHAGIGMQAIHPFATRCVAAKQRVGKTARTIAAHLGSRAVAVVQPHARVDIVDALEQQQAVGADT